MNNPLISVIIPVYNAEDTLDRCIRSLLAQTHRNTELLFINDGSTDYSAAILFDYAKRDKRIRVLSIRNSGPGMARNIGLEHMQGDYFCFADSDDYADRHYLSRMLSEAVLYHADIVQTDYFTVNEKGEIKSGRKHLPELITGTALCLRKFSEQERITNFPWGKLFRSSLMKDIRFPALYKSEDKVFLFKAFERCNCLYLSDQKLYYYVMEPGSLSRAPFSLKDLDEVKAGLEIHKLCARSCPSLLPYWNTFIASKAALTYCKLKGISIADKQQLLQSLAETFDTFFRKCRLSFILKRRKRGAFILLFRLSKSFTAWMYEQLLHIV